jgi:serine/threonine protein kinase
LDIKPGNFVHNLNTCDEKSEIIESKLIDFSTSVSLNQGEQSISLNKHVMGTPIYMAREINTDNRLPLTVFLNFIFTKKNIFFYR